MIPIAVAIARDGGARAGWVIVVEECPLCGGEHIHEGGRGPRPQGGFRSPDCAAQTAVYEVFVAEIWHPVVTRESLASP